MALKDKLHNRIMRRVYYAFALRLATNPLTVHTAIFAVCVFALSRLTHVAAIMENVSNVKVGELNTYIYGALMQAEFLTLVCLGIIIFTLLSLPLRLSTPRTRSMQTV